VSLFVLEKGNDARESNGESRRNPWEDGFLPWDCVCFRRREGLPLRTGDYWWPMWMMQMEVR